MKIILFGANGFLGKEISKLFDENNLDYYTVSRNPKNNDYAVDISNFSDFEVLPNHFFDVVINCATVLPGGNFLDNDYLEKIYKTNILGTQNICKWIDTQTSVTKIINCSTLVVSGKPWEINLTENATTYPTGSHVLYSSSKLVQELIFATLSDQKNINLIQLRFSALYGKSMSWSGIICNLIDQARKNNIIKLTNGFKVNADFLHVSDAAKIVYKTLESNVFGIINAASGNETSIMELAKLIANDNVEIQNIENGDFKVDNAIIDISKLKKIINTNDFVDLKTGITEMINL